MRFRLRTLLILLLVLPPLLAWAWFGYREYQARQADPWDGELSLIHGGGQTIEPEDDATILPPE